MRTYNIYYINVLPRDDYDYKYIRETTLKKFPGPGRAIYDGSYEISSVGPSPRLESSPNHLLSDIERHGVHTVLTWYVKLPWQPVCDGWMFRPEGEDFSATR